MNKQELIAAYERVSNFAETVEIKSVIEKLKQLDEPQKPVVPQFVADWYEGIVDEFYFVLERLVLNYKNNTDMPICKWFFETEDALTILINMHQFGYTVEEEKRYYVRFKWIEEAYSYLTLIKHLNTWTLYSITLDKKFRTEHTRKELEQAGFGWVFDCEGVEVEEVE
jgi:gp178